MRKLFFVIFLLISCGCLKAEVQNVETLLENAIHYRTDGVNLIGYLDIKRDHSIDQSTYLQVKYALEDFRAKGVCFVLMHLNTPGGEVFSSMKIAELLQELDEKYHIPVVALIDNWALSAGAMLAYSCRFIAITSTALMGAAEPITAGSEGKMETAPEKIISALRAEFTSLAKFYGRNPLIAEAMVDKDLILVKRGQEIVALKSDDQIRIGKHPDQVITVKGKLLTLDTQQLIALNVADFMVSGNALQEITAAEQQTGQLPASKSKLFTYPFFAKIPHATMISYEDWRVDFFALLTHPLIGSLLMMGLMIGIYMEMSHPGFGLPGAMALFCLSMILLSHFATDAFHLLEVLLVAIGVLLLLIEVFVLPGFGVAGIIGIALILSGVIAILLPSLKSVEFSWNWNEWNLATLEFFDRLTLIFGAVILSFVIIALLSRYVTPRLMRRNKLILEADQEGSVAGLEKHALPQIGSEGKAFTALRPGGKVIVNNIIYDALSEGNFIEQGEKVVVSKIHGSAIIVVLRN